MTDSMLETQVDDRGVAVVTITRPDKHNAFNEALISELTETFVRLGTDDDVRVVILTGEGRSFSAGADINWMRSMSEFSEDENIEDALRLAELMFVLDSLGKPTVARVNGAAFGGGVGLVACCDIAVAAEHALFGLTEVRLGLVPSVISPYVLEAIGARQARRFFMTGERMDAATAVRIGLVHEAVPQGRLDEAVEGYVRRLLKGGPVALRACKELVHEEVTAATSADESLKLMTAKLIAQLRVSEEGQEGLAAFLEKREPRWVRPGPSDD